MTFAKYCLVVYQYIPPVKAHEEHDEAASPAFCFVYSIVSSVELMAKFQLVQARLQYLMTAGYIHSSLP